MSYGNCRWTGAAAAPAVEASTAARMRIARVIKVPTNAHYIRTGEYPRRMNRVERDAALLQELYTAGTLVNLLVTEELERAGVPAELFSFLGWIRNLEPVTPGGLAAETGLPPTTIRDYVRRSVARGTVRKRPNPEDGRSYHLVLTAKGRRLMDRGWPAVIAAFLRLEQNLDRPAEDYLLWVRGLRAGLKQTLIGAAAPQVPQ